jgi:23S rRNA (cytidine1920-2'-O)/16S rRNA (cytidine1409-2'-O)-methyltransferase
MPGRRRLDQRLVELGLAETRSKAQGLILAGEVQVGGVVMDKPGTQVALDAPVLVRARSPYVSRGGEKLAGALAAFAFDPAGLRCLDAGASTGGFTDCLLQRGAASVLAVDVGYGQLAVKLRDDPRVRVVERSNVRHFELPPDVPALDLVTADLSFISLAKVLPRLASFARPGGHLLLLVKPQFELERGEVGSGGVVRDPALRDAAVARVRAAAEALALRALAEAESVLAGPKGNRERFLLLQAPDTGER